MDPLMTASYTGVNGGFVAVVADDPGMHSSQNEQDTRWAGPYAKIPVVEPSNPHESYSFVKEAFALSEQFDTPVICRMTTRVSHSKENITVGPRAEMAPKPFSVNIPKYVMIPKNARPRHVAVEARYGRLLEFAEETALNRIEPGDKKIGFITSGVAYHYLRESYPDAWVLKLGLAWPLCEKKIRAFAESVDQVMIVEELDPFYEYFVRSFGIPVRGKHPSFQVGELKPEYIPDLVAGREKKEKVISLTPPAFCKGCPHRLVFKALNELKLVVAGDIGCYALGALPPFESLHTCLCMGSAVTLFEGFRRAHFPEEKRVVGVIGDSTFFHSGITGLVNAAYNRMKGVLLILDNSTTAMTGGQHHPGTGKTIKGQQTKVISLEEICRASGADSVDIIRPQDYKSMQELITQRLEQDVLSVIIVRSPCMLIK
jgi:indolepyruvate ferredoxin oxidoreductase alpha subunit